jgi:hypothetical protein
MWALSAPQLTARSVVERKPAFRRQFEFGKVLTLRKIIESFTLNTNPAIILSIMTVLTMKVAQMYAETKLRRPNIQANLF